MLDFQPTRAGAPFGKGCGVQEKPTRGDTTFMALLGKRLAKGKKKKEHKQKKKQTDRHRSKTQLCRKVSGDRVQVGRTKTVQTRRRKEKRKKQRVKHKKGVKKSGKKKGAFVGGVNKFWRREGKNWKDGRRENTRFLGKNRVLFRGENGCFAYSFPGEGGGGRAPFTPKQQVKKQFAPTPSASPPTAKRVSPRKRTQGPSSGNEIRNLFLQGGRRGETGGTGEPRQSPTTKPNNLLR